ncbi:MAG TPA: penicillin acylase family protein [Anaerolineales bacterium]|nr:penicillin acylase family protein [Anaerolineales bacterium]HMV95543.1 penicillin acylase family protein [Anaerolineales bacterium]HNA56266.1 penicillin acylase family protein [Anaerolineales bacterium]HNB88682.1 penicillin acylase family protein [Anaerolineales bacterium]HNC91415.1 penicillin acylase family protein [Anaerolineales bacterium]
MKKLGRFVGRMLIGVVVLALIAGAGGMYYFKSYLPNTVAPKSFPQIDGEISVSGLNGQVDIYRDAMGIPHIYADTTHDLFFAQGYVHAQERFWQMDAWRHIGSGRLSEMFGSGQADTDAFLRTLGWKQTAEEEWKQLDPESKAILEAYVEGVNAYLKDHSDTALSLEYAILGLLSPDYEIEEWTPVNSLTWGKAMAWDLRGNMGEEIERAVLLKTLTPEQVAQLFPAYPEDHPVIVNNIGEGGSAASAGSEATLDYSQVPFENISENVALLDSFLGPWNDGIGSNSWAVSGKLSDTGMPLLANDPHLGIQMPSIWFQVGLHCNEKTAECPFEVAGFSFAGVPGVIIGHNDQIAWGFTNVGPDVMDLYIERVNPENPNQYDVNGTWVDFDTREEVIKMSDGTTQTITVRSTRHGPVISDQYGPLKDVGDPEDTEFVPFKDRVSTELPEQYVISLAWTALIPSTPFEAIWGFDKARNWKEFRKAASGFHVPAQNLIYADIEGNIGYQMPGDIPIRAKGDGTLPVPGWTDEYEWQGFLPFEELPYTLNPEEGYIVTANNQVHPRDYPYFISADWDYGFRANRIVEMITTAPGKIDIAYIQQMHGDSFDANGPVFVPLLLNEEFASDLNPALDTLKNWDYQGRADSTSAAVFNAFWRALLQNTFNDDMPEERYYPDGGSRWNEVMRHMAENPNDPFWDDKTTPDVTETMQDMIQKSFPQGIAELQEIFGKDMSKWKWGDMHASTFRNGTLGESGVSLIEDLFNRGPFPTSGGEAIVNATGWSVKDGYETNWLPSMRMIVDLGDLNNSVTVHTTGESGHAYHPHYADMAPMWAGIQYYPMWWNQDSVIGDAEGHLILKP